MRKAKNKIKNIKKQKMILSKEQIEKLQKDEAADIENFKAAMSELTDARKLASRLTQELSAKYGLEFGGWIKIDYGFFEKTFALRFANGQAFVFDASDILSIPSKIAFLRKEQLIKKLKEERKNETNTSIYSI